MAEALDLLVLHVPGLSARMLHAHEDRLPVLRRMAQKGSAATVAVLEGASPAQLEWSLVTGLLPEYASRARPFWERAAERRGGLRAHVAMIHHDAGSFSKGDTNLLWESRREFETPGDDAARLHALDEFLRGHENNRRAVAVVSSWARLASGARASQDAHPLDRPVLIQRGLEQARDCIGICEIAGVFKRALTGERLRDEA